MICFQPTGPLRSALDLQFLEFSIDKDRGSRFVPYHGFYKGRAGIGSNGDVFELGAATRRIGYRTGRRQPRPITPSPSNTATLGSGIGVPIHPLSSPMQERSPR
jgi:hypothetical protein